MRKKIKFLDILLVLLPYILFIGCEKNELQEPADKYVGSFTYFITVSWNSSYSYPGLIEVTKTASNKITILPSIGGPTYYTVNDNSIVEDPDQTCEIPLKGGGTDIFTENSTGTLSGNVLTINGTWTKKGYDTQTFDIVATKK